MIRFAPRRQFPSISTHLQSSCTVPLVSLSPLVSDTSFTLQNVTTAVESVNSQGSLGFYLGVPRRKYRSGKEILQYFITTVPRASWETLAGGLCYQQEHAVLETVKEYLRPQPGMCVGSLEYIVMF